jgi:hypothetical protein
LTARHRTLEGFWCNHLLNRIIEEFTINFLFFHPKNIYLKAIKNMTFPKSHNGYNIESQVLQVIADTPPE